ncbi:MAG: heme A synthase, partial [Sandarakinorhabdus sp.]|nr:heme A synthase [Sandarakinorhabdus sp.]
MATLAASFTPAPRTRTRPRAIAAWLFGVALMVFAMVVVGGITRL